MIRPARNVPWPERLGKQIRHAVVWAADFIALGGKVPPVVVAHPDLPSRRTTLHKVCRANRWELTNLPRNNAMITLRFEDATVKAQPMPPALNGVIWNAACTDISKRTLDSHHLAVFGYGVGIDPLTHEGPLLEKSNGNAAHDGVERQGPLNALLPDKVYQRIINNRDEQGRVCDLRLVYVCGLTPVTYLKFKSDDARYTNETTGAELAATQTLFSDHELGQIGQLMHRLGVDIAELDILRDRSSDQLFVVDVNPTPWGPPAGLNSADASEAIAVIAKAFQEALHGMNQPSK